MQNEPDIKKSNTQKKNCIKFYEQGSQSQTNDIFHVLILLRIASFKNIFSSQVKAFKEAKQIIENNQNIDLENLQQIYTQYFSPQEWYYAKSFLTQDS